MFAVIINDSRTCGLFKTRDQAEEYAETISGIMEHYSGDKQSYHIHYHIQPIETYGEYQKAIASAAKI